MSSACSPGQPRRHSRCTTSMWKRCFEVRAPARARTDLAGAPSLAGRTCCRQEPWRLRLPSRSCSPCASRSPNGDRALNRPGSMSTSPPFQKGVPCRSCSRGMARNEREVGDAVRGAGARRLWRRRQGRAGGRRRGRRRRGDRPERLRRVGRAGEEELHEPEAGVPEAGLTGVPDPAEPVRPVSGRAGAVRAGGGRLRRRGDREAGGRAARADPEAVLRRRQEEVREAAGRAGRDGRASSKRSPGPDRLGEDLRGGHGQGGGDR